MRGVTGLLQSRPFVLAVVCTVLASATGCWVQSVYPFYEESDVLVDNNLVGDWIGEGELKNCLLKITLQREGKTYTIATSDAGSKQDSRGQCDSGALEGKLIQIGQQRFVDVVPDEDKSWAPLDLILKIESDKQRLVLTPLDAEWTANAMADKIVKLQGRSHEEEYGAAFPVVLMRVYLVSPTSELRDFLREHGNDRGAFSRSGQMVFQRR
jgi:hypothetical protein